MRRYSIQMLVLIFIDHSITFICVVHVFVQCFCPVISWFGITLILCNAVNVSNVMADGIINMLTTQQWQCRTALLTNNDVYITLCIF